MNTKIVQWLGVSTVMLLVSCFSFGMIFNSFEIMKLLGGLAVLSAGLTFSVMITSD